MAPRLVSFLCVGERLQGFGVPNAMAPEVELAARCIACGLRDFMPRGP